MLDGDDIPFEDIRRNMQELDFINTHLGGHQITIDGIKKIFSRLPFVNKDHWIICEIGCGGGDNLAAIKKWCRHNCLQADFIGIDINPHCIEVAKTKLSPADAQFIVSDYRLTDFGERKPDIIFSSLFCHHFKETELVNMLRWMRENAGLGFFINDLHRHPLAYYPIRLLTNLFSSSYLVKNDAPLSVLRGFKKLEWEKILESAGITAYTIEWKWAFRYLIMVDLQDHGANKKLPAG